MRELALSYGVDAHYMTPSTSTDEFQKIAVKKVKKLGKLKCKDRVLTIAGSFGLAAEPSFLNITTVENAARIGDTPYSTAEDLH